MAGRDARAGLRVAPVDGRADMARFLRLPWSIYAGDPHWVPPLLAERRGHLNPKANPFFQHADVGFWLAWRDGRPVGRISAQVNHLHLERYGDATGHFGLLEAEDDPETFAALFAIAEGFLRERGMRRVIGPFSLSINDESGLLVDGADTPPSMLMGHAPAYYATRLSALGFVRAKDLMAFAYDLTAPMPAAAARFVDRLADDPSIRFRGLRKANYAEDLAIVIDIFNDAWSENWGYVPFTEAEIAHFNKELKPLVRTESLCLAEVDGEPVAMAICLPNLNEAIADLDGRLLPFGWAKLLWRLKIGPMRSARVPLFGVRRRYHGSPMGAALAYGVIDRLRRDHAALGFREAELSWVLEDNTAMRSMIEAVGGRAYKTYRLFEKALA